MTTVGYGDYYPVSLPGYIYTSFIMIQGLMITALPVAIIGGNYAILYDHNQKREKRKKRADKKRRREISDVEHSSDSEQTVRCVSCRSSSFKGTKVNDAHT